MICEPHDRAEQLVKQFATRDPFMIAEGCGIYLSFRDIGGIKGFYKIINRERHIVINQNIGRPEARIICAHELGHDMLHRDFARSGAALEMTLFDMSTRPEHEANLFAADLLVSDEDMIEALRHYDIAGAATSLMIGRPLAVCKLCSLSERLPGFVVPDLPADPFR